MNNLKNINRQLQKKFGGDDSFINAHQILKINRPKKDVPTWVGDNKAIKAFLLRSFPKMKISPVDRKRAGRWARVINLYFVQNWTRGQIAEELGLSYDVVNRLIHRIKNAAKGVRSDIYAPLGLPKGRPRKKQVRI